MADPLYNATAQIARAKSTVSGTNDLTREHGEAAPETVRCSLRQLSVEKTQSVFGAHQVEAYACRLVTATDVPTASTIEVCKNGSETYLEYRVQTARRTGRALNLLLTRV